MGQWFAIGTIVVLTIMVLEQLSFQMKRKNLPGPSWVAPFIGGIVAMVMNPYKFWHEQMALGDLSWNSIVGRFTVVVTDAHNVRKIFTGVSDDMPLALHPNAYTLLGKDNIAFLNGSVHKRLKQKLLPLFTQHALKTYVDIQVKCIREYFQSWEQKIKVDGELKMRDEIYDLNTHTSFGVFVGPYLNKELRKMLVEDYTALTNAMLGFPLNFPGTLLWKGYKARPRLLKNLMGIAAAAKARARENITPECLLDFWMANTVKEIDEAEKNGLPEPEHSSDMDIAKVLVDFLFASQDASTASLTWVTHLLGIYPDVLKKVREELRELHKSQGNPDKPLELNADVLGELKYVKQVTKEILRYRPPATIVPHQSVKEVELDGYTVPKGALIVPSIWSANRCGFPNPEQFDPDRFSDERKEHVIYEREYLTFGAGPHTCLGQRYAYNHIMCFMAILAYEHDFERKSTPNMHDIIYLPTIYPADHAVYNRLTSRDWRSLAKA